MKRRLLFSMMLIAATATVTYTVLSGGKAQSKTAPAPVKAHDEILAARGRVEPISEEIHIGAEVSGKLQSVLVKEGDRVRAGQVIAVLENDEYRAQVTSAEARLQEKQATLRRVVHGARDQERQEAMALVKEAEAVMENARSEADRRKGLLEKGAISREEADRAEQAYKVARARHEAAVQHHRLLDDAAREEDRSRAEAEVQLALGQLAESRARLAKTFVRSPINGVVLRKHHNSGETVLDAPATPIVTLGDVSRLRVRAEVDESDIAAIAVGQKVYVTADAYGNKRFTGTLARIGSALGKKQVVSDEPADLVDRKILEAFVDLAPGTSLRPGLRVDVFIELGDGSHAAR